MRVLLTGHDGYIGAVMIPALQAAGHEVVGLDSGLFEQCSFGPYRPQLPAIRRDIRDVTAEDLAGFDALVHLAAISNDPLGNLNPDCTYDINHRASVRLAELAKRARIERFLYASSCSVYGAASPDDVLDETAPFRPVTPYAESKVLVESDVSKLADDGFSPTFMRNATVYGVSPRLRGDLVVNNLVGWGFATGRVHLKSDGTPWRPLVHVEDVCHAFCCALAAPRGVVHNHAFNVGRGEDNLRIRQVAELVQRAVAGSRITFEEGAGPDPRCYRVDFSRIRATLGDYRPGWTVERGVAQLLDAYREVGLDVQDLEGDRYLRIAHIQRLLDEGRLDSDLRWVGGGRPS
jgi:nucleoside-diphosphate-sugar epimerase